MIVHVIRSVSYSIIAKKQRRKMSLETGKLKFWIDFPQAHGMMRYRARSLVFGVCCSVRVCRCVYSVILLFCSIYSFALY